MPYSREFLLSRRSAGGDRPDFSFLTAEECRLLRPRKRGQRGGVKIRMRRRRYSLPLPSIVFGNVQSIRNKQDELSACAKYQHEYREANIVCLSESWLKEKDSDPELPGFSVYRSDRSSEVTGKFKGGGVCAFINSRWCTNVTVRDQFCSEHIEVLCIALRPFYLPREFNQIFLTVVYIHPAANVKAAADKISSVAHRLSSQSPDAPSFILGDFNKCRLSRVLPAYRQYVTCATHKDNTIDQCYGNIPKAYVSIPVMRLGRSPHTMVQLVPIYKQRLKREKPVIRHIQTWSREAVERLNDCFDATDWDVFLDGGELLDEVADVVSHYINFCADIVVDRKKVTLFPNSKPWITSELKHILAKKRKAHRSGDAAQVKTVQKEIDRNIREAKKRYSRKLEENFAANNPKQYWKNIQTITGYKQSKPPLHTTDEAGMADKLNAFYSRFDLRDFKREHAEVMERVQGLPALPVTIGVEEVRAQFRRVKPKSATGPDNISSSIIRKCSDSLAPVYSRLFQRSIDEGHIPSSWKMSTIIPVAKKRWPKVHNDFRPIALTSVPFKCAEKLVLRRLREETAPYQDRMQFAYQKDRSAEDAIVTMLHHLHQHLDRPRTYARILFIDFSSAFNTIQPHLLIEKLLDMQVNPTILCWIYSFLTDRPQRVRVGQTLSATVTTNTGAPQGCVLSPALFTLYTADCRSADDNNLLIKFADDTSLTGLLRESDLAYRAAVSDLVNWCDRNYLDLNVTKTKELIVDFRLCKEATEPLVIKGQAVEIVESYKYLGTMIDSKLDWSANVDLCCKKASQRLYFLRKLRAFGVGHSILFLFYQATVQNILLYNHVCFFNSTKQADAERMEKIVRTAQRIIRHYDLKSASSIYENTAVRKLKRIMADPGHPLHPVVSRCCSSRSSRMISLKARTNRLRDSFLPTALRLFNRQHSRLGRSQT